MTDKTPARQDIYSLITAQIVAELEKGVRPWHKPWAAGHIAGPISRPLRANGVSYSGINIIMLWATAMQRGYSAPIWITYRQAAELGAHVRKGEKGALVVYASRITRTEQDEQTGEEVEREIPFLKSYHVFNVEQIEGLPAHYTATHPPRLNPEQRIPRGKLLRRDRRRHPLRRQQRLLRSLRRLHPDAALRELSRCRQLLRDPRS